MNKFDRRNQAKQARITKHKEYLRSTSIFSGRDGAPRIVALLPLCADTDARSVIEALNSSVDVEGSVSNSPSIISVERFKQRIQYILPSRQLDACLDAARMADFVVVMLSADVEVDDLGELILRGVESQGMSSLFTLVHGLQKLESVKQKQSILGSLKSFITHFHPEQDKLYSLENRQECANLMRSLCSTTPKGIKWRDERSWMLAEEMTVTQDGSDRTIVTGVIRGKGLQVDRLLQVGDMGAFQIEQIIAAPLSKHGKQKDTTTVDEDQNELLAVPTADQDDLSELAPGDVIMGEISYDDDAEVEGEPSQKKGVLLDDHHYFTDEEEEQRKIKRKVPKGTSDYQAAWYLDDVSDSGSDMEDMDMKDEKEEAAPEDGIEGFTAPEATEGGPSEYPQSEMMEPGEEEDAAQLENYRAGKRGEVDDDKEFPDEIELQPQVLARERLARYRGLKSLRTSTWQEDEDRAHEPEDWRRLLQVPDYASSKSRATREALVGGVEPGTRVAIYLRGKLPISDTPTNGIPVVSLLRHEQKRTVVNYLINLSTDYTKSIKSKEEIIIQCGSRRMVINPVFSQAGTTPNDVHKFCRYLHPGQSAVATFLGPLTWGAVPVLFFKRTPLASGEEPSQTGADLKLIGTGTSLPPSTTRVIAKRLILTGHPYHIHKKIVTIRYMFFNREDVEWFKALPLWTKRGRSGFIKEPLGTHGYLKATFDGRINPQDAIGVSLYKRVWPRTARSLPDLALDAQRREELPEGDEEMT